MRKYFLLSAVALLATTTANATTDYAEVTARAEIQVANESACDDIDFGTIVVKDGNEAFTIGFSGITGDGESDVISVGEYTKYIHCTNMGDSANIDEETIILKNKTGDEMSLRLMGGIPSDEEFAVYLDVPNNVHSGEYTASFTIAITY
ncbi:MAG: hypothetical protein E7016_00305 [Alphaproteobacteria bacterium]|nr:hypothetical protein [Alphaproteobacteria bacterium]